MSRYVDEGGDETTWDPSGFAVYERWWEKVESSKPPRHVPANKGLISREAACTADVLVTLAPSTFVPGYAAVKAAAGALDITFNPVEFILGYRPLLSADPTIPSIAAGASSANWFYKQYVFGEAGGQARLERLQDLASRTFSGAKNAAKYGGKIDELQRLSKAVSRAQRSTTALSVVSAGYDVYTCLGGE
jgi:hypothetical protein